MNNFTPVAAAIGGSLVGLAAVLMMLLTGRIAGISGIFGGLLSLQASDKALHDKAWHDKAWHDKAWRDKAWRDKAWRDKAWRLAFVAGLILAPLTGTLAGYALEEPQMPASLPLVAVAGLLVGVGTRIGGGCTSGHGVCGVARLSTRSIVATVTFMAAAVVTVAMMRHVFGA
jgi:uncharacterized membrane protein YedE/YeeE